MRKFLILIKKELKELITPQLIIPLILMVSVFGGLGGVLSNEAKKENNKQTLWILNNDKGEYSQELIDDLAAQDIKIELQNGLEQEVLALAQEQNRAGFISFPENFTRSIKEYKQPELTVYQLAEDFSISSVNKQSRIGAASAMINKFVQDKWLAMNDYQVDATKFHEPLLKKEITVVKEKQAQVSFFVVYNFIQQQTTYIPIILFIVIVLASQMVAASVASEKESKTLETLLSLPVGRKSIVLAKLSAAGLVALLFAVFYLFGFSRYMGGITSSVSPGLGEVSGSLGAIFDSLGLSFGLPQYALLGLSLFLGILSALSIALILGLLAENVKSVQSTVAPLVFLILIPYLLTMFVDLANSAPFLKYLVYSIPFSYPFLAIQKLLTQDYLFVLFGLVYQFIFLLFMIFLTTRVFSTDKIITMRLGKKIIR